MASGNSLLYFTPFSTAGPNTAAAQGDILLGGSTPAEAIPVLAFDPTTVEYADFRGKLPQHYTGGGLSVILSWGAAAAAGGVTWEAAFRAIPSDTEDLDTSHSYDFNSLDVATPPSAIGEVIYSTIPFTDGADMDSLAAGQEFILRVRRATGDSNDTLVGDAYLHGIEVREA